eukprot:COSAG05_NODE_2310_length_3245_cov_1.416084_5_plen_312_part_01
MGGRAALYMGAVDGEERVQGIVSINGWTPMRSDTNRSSTGGLRRLWSWHALQPALGFFDGQENQLPYDMDDVIVEASGANASTAILIYQQELDRENDYEGVKASVAKAKAAGANVELQSAPTVNMLNDAAHNAVITWLKQKAGLTPSTVGDCARGLPNNMTPLKLVSCTEPQLANHTRFEMSSADGTMRLSRCPSHACAIDCAQAGDCSKAGTLSEPEKMVLSGKLSAQPDLDNFHFSVDDKDDSIRFNPVATQEGDAPILHKCLEGSGLGAQIMLAKCSGSTSQKWTHTSTKGQFKWGANLEMCLGWVAV